MTRLLSISSYVCAGGPVGNRVGMYVLDSFGIDTAFVNTTHLANHTNYKACTGGFLSVDELRSILATLHTNELDHFTAAFLGYFPSAALLREARTYVEQLRREHPAMWTIVDPILGDNGRLYTNPEVVEEMRQTVLIADVIVPNFFELGVLAGRDVATRQDAVECCRILHTQGVPAVIVTSLNEDGHIVLLASFASNCPSPT